MSLENPTGYIQDKTLRWRWGCWRGCRWVLPPLVPVMAFFILTLHSLLGFINRMFSSVFVPPFLLPFPFGPPLFLMTGLSSIVIRIELWRSTLVIWFLLCSWSLITSVTFKSQGICFVPIFITPPAVFLVEFTGISAVCSSQWSILFSDEILFVWHLDLSWGGNSCFMYENLCPSFHSSIFFTQTTWNNRISGCLVSDHNAWKGLKPLVASNANLE